MAMPERVLKTLAAAGLGADKAVPVRDGRQTVSAAGTTRNRSFFDFRVGLWGNILATAALVPVAIPVARTQDLLYDPDMTDW